MKDPLQRSHTGMWVGCARPVPRCRGRQCLRPGTSLRLCFEFQRSHHLALTSSYVKEDVGVRHFVQALDVRLRIVPESVLEVVDVHGGEKGSEVYDVRG